MYEVLVTEEFIDVIKNLPMEVVPKLTNSFVSIKKVKCEENVKKTFWNDFKQEVERRGV